MGLGINPPCLLLPRPEPRVPLGVVQDARRRRLQWRSDDRWRAARGGAAAGARAAGCPVNRSQPAGCRRRPPSPGNNDQILRNPRAGRRASWVSGPRLRTPRSPIHPRAPPGAPGDPGLGSFLVRGQSACALRQTHTHARARTHTHSPTRGRGALAGQVSP